MTREEAENWIASLINLVREECLAIENGEFAREVRLEKKIKECTALIVKALTGKEE